MKKLLKITISVLLIAVFLLFGIYYLFFDTSRIAPEELIATYSSPNGTYELNMYRNNGGATSDYAVLGVLTKPDDADYSRNIYWNNNCDEANAEWLDDDTVVINGTKIDDVLKNKYDFRYMK